MLPTGSKDTRPAFDAQGGCSELQYQLHKLLLHRR